jgi:RNA polymerase-binding transcription factor DksA
MNMIGQRQAWADIRTTKAGVDLHQGQVVAAWPKVGPKEDHSMTSLNSRKATLAARLSDLEGRIGQIGAELGTHQAKDWEDLATERESDEVLEGMGLSAQAELRMIKAALGRIDTGDYGTCAKCGAEIAPARLDLLPFTPFCRDCAE